MYFIDPEKADKSKLWYENQNNRNDSHLAFEFLQVSGATVKPEDQTGIGADCQELGQGIDAGEIQVVPENAPLHSLRHLGQQRCQRRPLTQHPLAKLSCLS